ncbi:glutaredoxin-like protein [endosymbiont of Acanthamoeba sp. UWC8]|uniref:Grx4 family monothiol glutaredoxin n=1 Tax=endosymbiont of Acanthamoeba sp. UWC8 TaxID=86106 RepID=UPI0004D19CB3|nr:Grx4 family monothiol glutaredoxin [endosymbiont of Acanthamoeba sp. UWC8]AIF81333.1 glutaredoxin-like protein [endosymbiont of Acanthamoeba sp. UWC8]
MDDVLSQIKNEIENNDIVLFLKGTANMPQCGFSGVVVQILNRLELPFKDINILESEELRQGIKEFSNWPTIPQLYIKQEFIGGCDIVREMYLSGQLQNLLQEKGLK